MNKITFPLKSLELNNKQFKIVNDNNINSKKIILSCAGSGKTLLIITRISFMIYKLGCNSENFFLATFNRNAAEEMKQRLCQLIGINDVNCGTFHHLGIKLLKKYNDHNNHQEYIYLHINSFGGSVFSAFSVIDTIKNMKVPVVSIIEGAAASAATLISVMCDYRIIYKTSYMLIHQLSSGSWGKMNELEEEMENLKELMNSIKTIYKENTNIPRGEISEILKHDLWWNADICLAKGLVDEIKTTDKKYKFSKGMITF